MEQYIVTGMSCAACSSHVEKAVSKVPGVTMCSVNLLTNSMKVEGSVPPDVIIAAVEKAGYGASLKASGNRKAVSVGMFEVRVHAVAEHVETCDTGTDVLKKQAQMRRKCAGGWEYLSDA